MDMVLHFFFYVNVQITWSCEMIKMWNYNIKEEKKTTPVVKESSSLVYT